MRRPPPPRLTRGEYWLLESAVERKLPLDVLHPSELAAAVLGKPGHGLDRARLEATLERLAGDGRIAIERDATGRLRYGLTARGGACFEAFAAPRWKHFVAETFVLEEDGYHWRGEIAGLSRKRLGVRLHGLRDRGIHLEERSLSREHLQPWAATYWKVLPRGQRLRFRCLRGKPGLDAPPPFDASLWYPWR